MSTERRMYVAIVAFLLVAVLIAMGVFISYRSIPVTPRVDTQINSQPPPPPPDDRESQPVSSKDSWVISVVGLVGLVGLFSLALMIWNANRPQYDKQSKSFSHQE